MSREQVRVESALEAQRDGPRHNHMPVPAPDDVKKSAIELYGRSARDEPSPVGRDERGACAAAAGASDPGTTLPYPQPDVTAVTDRGHADIRALRKNLITFEFGTERSQIDRIDIGHEERGVRVAEIGANRRRKGTERQLDVLGVHGPAQRDLAPARTYRSHIDRDAPIRQSFGFEQA